MNIIIIKNMVCPRCIEAVKKIFEEMDLSFSDIQLGKVVTQKEISVQKRRLLKDQLVQQGFELLDDKQSQIISRVKTIIINQVHHKKQLLKVNFSTLISENLHYDYAHLSRLFSSVEGITIERFIMSQKIEKVKELLTYDEMTISEIAFDMGYSSNAHLSGQFKKITGMSPTSFKKLHQNSRQSLDQL